MRSFSRSLILLLMAVCWAAPSPLAARDSSKDEITQKFRREIKFEPGGTIRLENAVGEIEIIGWDESRVEIRAVKKVRYEDDEKRARSLLEEMTIEIEVDGNEIGISSSFPSRFDLDVNHDGGFSLFDLLKLGQTASDMAGEGLNTSISYRIRVPRRMFLRVEQAVGEIDIRGIEGEVRVENSVGELELADIIGEINAETSVGEIDIRRISGPAVVSARVGEINLGLSRDAAVDLKACCTLGDIDCGLKLTEARRQGFIIQGLRGKYNSGGPLIRLETNIGEINIEED